DMHVTLRVSTDIRAATLTNGLTNLLVALKAFMAFCLCKEKRRPFTAQPQPSVEPYGPNLSIRKHRNIEITSAVVFQRVAMNELRKSPRRTYSFPWDASFQTPLPRFHLHERPPYSCFHRGR